MNKFRENKKGFALLLAMIVSGIVLTIGMGLLSVTLKQIQLGIGTLDSERAFQAAAAGMDCLRYLRNEQFDNFTENDQTVTVDCFNLSGVTMRDLLRSSNGEHPYRQRFQTQFDWDTGAGDLCIQLDVHVLNALTEDKTWLTTDRGLVSCDEGDICTFGFAQANNVACAEVPNNPRAVLRELSATF